VQRKSSDNSRKIYYKSIYNLRSQEMLLCLTSSRTESIAAGTCCATIIPGQQVAQHCDSFMTTTTTTMIYRRRRSRWLHDLRRKSARACLLRLWFQIPPVAWMSVVRWRSLWRADHSSRGVLLNVVRRCVWSRNLKNKEAIARVGPQLHRKKNIYTG
jgi:hypothetical protein